MARRERVSLASEPLTRSVRVGTSRPVSRNSSAPGGVAAGRTAGGVAAGLRLLHERERGLRVAALAHGVDAAQRERRRVDVAWLDEEALRRRRSLLRARRRVERGVERAIRHDRDDIERAVADATKLRPALHVAA